MSESESQSEFEIEIQEPDPPKSAREPVKPLPRLWKTEPDSADGEDARPDCQGLVASQEIVQDKGSVATSKSRSQDQIVRGQVEEGEGFFGCGREIG